MDKKTRKLTPSTNSGRTQGICIEQNYSTFSESMKDILFVPARKPYQNLCPQGNHIKQKCATLKQIEQ